jgi:hypothetical protein
MVEPPKTPRKPLDLNRYCSTHGFKVKHGHNSQMCKTPGTDYNINATCENTITTSHSGGSQKCQYAKPQP